MNHKIDNTPVIIPFNITIYIDINKIFNSGNTAVQDTLVDVASTNLINTVSKYNKEIGILLQEFCKTKDASNDILPFITIDKDKIYYSKGISNYKLLGYIIPCTFHVTAFIKAVQSTKGKHYEH